MTYYQLKIDQQPTGIRQTFKFVVRPERAVQQNRANISVHGNYRASIPSSSLQSLSEGGNVSRRGLNCTWLFLKSTCFNNVEFNCRCLAIKYGSKSNCIAVPDNYIILINISKYNEKLSWRIKYTINSIFYFLHVQVYTFHDSAIFIYQT